MELAKVREEFEYARQNRRKIEQLRAQAESLRLSCMGRSIQYDKDNVQTSPEDYQAKAIAKAVDMEAEADRLIMTGDKTRAKLFLWMDICTAEERIVLTNHYINDMTYREIEYECADALDYKRFNAAFYIAQRGIEKISAHF